MKKSVNPRELISEKLFDDLQLTSVSIVAKKNSDSCFVNFDSGQFLILNNDIITTEGIAKNKTFSVGDLRHLIQLQRIVLAKKEAYRFAAMRKRSEMQIRNKLREKGFSVGETDKAISFLLTFGLIDDEEFARVFVSEKVQKKMLGGGRLKSELRRAGVSDEIADKVIAELFPQDREEVLNMMRQLASKKMRMISGKSPDKQKNSLILYLTAKGYKYEDIKRITDETDFFGNTD